MWYYDLSVVLCLNGCYNKYSATYIKKGNEGESNHKYLVSLYNEDGDFKVSFNPFINTISCSCRKFETFSTLCCHTIRVLDVKDIKAMPIQYILKRWTREAKSELVKDIYGRNVKEDTSLVSIQRYRRIWPKLVRVPTRASDCKGASIFIEKAAEELNKQIDDICKKNLGLENNNLNSSSISNLNLQFLPVKGLKRRNGMKKCKIVQRVGLRTNLRRKRGVKLPILHNIKNSR